MFVIKHQSHGALAHCRGNLFVVVLLTMAPPSQESESPANQGRFSSRSDGPSSYAASLLLTGSTSRIALGVGHEQPLRLCGKGGAGESVTAHHRSTRPIGWMAGLRRAVHRYCL